MSDGMDPAGPVDPVDPVDDATGELLSAYLDGEVTANEETTVRALLERSPAARAELEALRSARSALRGLPDVEPPPGFFEHLDVGPVAPVVPPEPPAAAGFRPRTTVAPAAPRERRHWSRGRGVRVAAAVGAVAVAVVLVLGITPVTDRLVPPVDAFAARHEAMAAGAPSVPNPSEMAFTEASDATLDRAGIPATMAGGLDRVHGFAGRDGMLHAVFSDGRTMVSVYAQPGAVKWSAMPTGGATMDVDGAAATEMGAGGEDVVVVDRGDRVFTVVAGGDHDRLMAVVHTLPEGERSMMDRMADGCRSLVESFGAGG